MAAIGLAIIIFVLGGLATTPSTTVVPAKGGTYIEATDDRPHTINPLLAQSSGVDQDLATLIFSGLTKINERGESEPDLAENWQVSQDGRVYTVRIKQGVRWHDGTPFSADDVLFTMSILKDPNFTSNPALAELWKDVQVRKVDPLTVRFELVDSFAPFPEYLTLGILPQHILKDAKPAQLAEYPFNASPIGTGIFKVQAVDEGQIILEANPFYYGSKPYLEKVVFRFYPNAQAAFLALRQGKVMGIRRVSPEALETVKGDDNIKDYSGPEYSKVSILYLNNRAPLFADKSIRQAVTYAIDRRQIIDNVLSGQGAPALGPIPPVSWAFKIQPAKSDNRLVEAEGLLEKAGWKKNQIDGVREKDGERLRLVILTNDNPQRVKVAEEIARQLAKAGMKTEVQATDWDGILRNFLVPRNFQALLAELWSPNFDPDSYPFWHSSQIKDRLNFASWANRQADQLLEDARRSGSQKERARMYGEFQDIFAEEQPSVMLYYPMYSYAIHKSIKGVKPAPMIGTSDRFRNIAEWYINTEVVINEPGDKPSGTSSGSR